MSSPALPYRRGDILPGTAEDVRKLAVAWRHLAERFAADDGAGVYPLSGLDRVLAIEPDDLAWMDDDLAPARFMEVLRQLALEHVGGDPARHDFVLLNRQTAALWLAAHVSMKTGDRVIGVSPTYSHPSVVRAVADTGAEFVDTAGVEAYKRALDDADPVAVVVLTRLPVSYEIFGQRELEEVTRLARAAGACIIADEASGARVGPAVFGQSKSLELDVDIATTGLDKYGTTGPRLGLLGGRKDLVELIRTRAFEMGMEARPMLYPAVVRSLERYSPQRVRDLVACTKEVAAALRSRIGGNRVLETELIVQLKGEDILALAMDRGGVQDAPIVAYEATAALSMLLLRDHGIFTVHFAGLPPGTSALLIKFVPPEVLERLGGAQRMAEAIDESLTSLADILATPQAIRELLLGCDA